MTTTGGSGPSAPAGHCCVPTSQSHSASVAAARTDCGVVKLATSGAASRQGSRFLEREREGDVVAGQRIDFVRAVAALFSK